LYKGVGVLVSFLTIFIRKERSVKQFLVYIYAWLNSRVCWVENAPFFYLGKWWHRSDKASPYGCGRVTGEDVEFLGKVWCEIMPSQPFAFARFSEDGETWIVVTGFSNPAMDLCRLRLQAFESETKLRNALKAEGRPRCVSINLIEDARRAGILK
jgi:hypothetical protein